MKELKYLILLPTVFFNSLFANPSITKTAEIDSLADKISIQVSTQEELFPVISKVINERDSQLSLPELVIWNITNNNNVTLTISLISEIHDGIPATIAPIVLTPGENKIIKQTPFGSKLLENGSFTAADFKFKH